MPPLSGLLEGKAGYVVGRAVREAAEMCDTEEVLVTRILQASHKETLLYGGSLESQL